MSLPCGVGGKDYDANSGEPYGCASKYGIVTTFEDAKTQDGLTYDYFIAWGYRDFSVCAASKQQQLVLVVELATLC